MSNQVPLFTTAPRIKIKLNGKPIAFAIGLNASVSVDLQPVRGLGEYAAFAIEATMVNVVTGTLQIQRVLPKETLQAMLAGSPVDPMSTGARQVAVNGENGAEIVTTTSDPSEFDSNNPMTIDSTHFHLNPSSVLLSRTFDLDLYLTVPVVGNAVADAILAGTPIPNGASADGALEEVRFASIQDVRLTSRNTNINFGQLVNEPLSYKGLLYTPVGLDNSTLFGLSSGQGQA